MNKLYFADCLQVLIELSREHTEGFIDLVYIDPPFNSKRDYNILFESIDLKDTKAQREAFADTWSNVSYVDTLNEIQELDLDLYSFLSALDKIRLSKGAISYLTTMAIRIYYIHKVLKDTGSFYLHCDPTMSHYLKLVCDLIFGEKNFRNEVVWKRSYGHGDSKKSLGRSHDTILFYSKSNEYTLNRFYHVHDQKYLEKFFKFHDARGVYKLENLTSPNPRPNLVYSFKGYPPPEKGWRVNLVKMEQLYAEDRLYFPKKSDGRIMKKVYLDELEGQPMTDLWTDIKLLSANDQERLGYPTQKPEALLERIIKASSNEGDIVADFFCGCGTAIASAQKLNRKWIGSDISHLAIKLILDRLTKPYSKARAKVIREDIQISGFPTDVAGAKMLAQETDNGRFSFQDWIVEFMMGGIANKKKIADGGFDGYLPFYINDKEKGIILIEVKSGNVTVKNVREFIQVVEKQKANMGVFVCFADKVTKPMLSEAKHAGRYEDKAFVDQYDKIQILTVEDLLDGKGVQLPYRKEAFKAATKKLEAEPDQGKLFEE